MCCFQVLCALQGMITGEDFWGEGGDVEKKKTLWGQILFACLKTVLQ